jgi:hypothetical protein
MDPTSFDTGVGLKAQPCEDRPRYRLGNALWVVPEGSLQLHLLGAFASLFTLVTA